MKRWLLLPLLSLPLFALLWSCGKEPVKQPSVAQTIEQRFPDLPTPRVIPLAPQKVEVPVVHSAPVKRPVVHKTPVKPHNVVKRVVKAPERLPQTEPEPVEQPPKPPCLFDFLAPCQPQEAAQ